MEEFEFFWQTESPFSNWHRSRFSEGVMNYSNAEQYLMFHKAFLFADDEVAKEIMEAKHPREMKALGRKIKNFNNDVWNEYKYAIMCQGLRLKFRQNTNLYTKLVNTFPKTLVEASPYDTIWGIGLEESDPRALNKETWLGENLLGKALTEVRNEFIDKQPFNHK